MILKCMVFKVYFWTDLNTPFDCKTLIISGLTHRVNFIEAHDLIIRIKKAF